MNHQCSGWSRVADSTPARIVGKSASRMPLVRIMSKYKRNMRKCEAVFAERAGYGVWRDYRGLSRLDGLALRAPGGWELRHRSVWDSVELSAARPLGTI